MCSHFIAAGHSLGDRTLAVAVSLIAIEKRALRGFPSATVSPAGMSASTRPICYWIADPSPCSLTSDLMPKFCDELDQACCYNIDLEKMN